MKDELEKAFAEAGDLSIFTQAMEKIAKKHAEVMNGDCEKHHTPFAHIVLLHGKAIRACTQCVERIKDGTYE